MNRIIPYVLCLIIAITLAGCAQSNQTAPEDVQQSNPEVFSSENPSKNPSETTEQLQNAELEPDVPNDTSVQTESMTDDTTKSKVPQNTQEKLPLIVSTNESFTNQPIAWKSPLNGMFERTYETQLSMLGMIDKTAPMFFEEDVLEFQDCAVLLGRSMDYDDPSIVGIAYILFKDGSLGRLPLPRDDNGMTVRPDKVTDNGDETLSYQVEAAGNEYCYSVDLSKRTVSMRPEEHYKIEETAEENRQPSGTTEQFQYAGLKLEVSNVINVRTESMTDDGGTVYEYQVYTCHPDAEVTVLNADMEDGELFEDKLPHAKWGFVQIPDETRLRIAEELEQTKNAVSELRGVSSLESNIYILIFEVET